MLIPFVDYFTDCHHNLVCSLGDQCLLSFNPTKGPIYSGYGFILLHSVGTLCAKPRSMLDSEYESLEQTLTSYPNPRKFSLVFSGELKQSSMYHSKTPETSCVGNINKICVFLALK